VLTSTEQKPQPIFGTTNPATSDVTEITKYPITSIAKKKKNLRKS
jgi:hypothetical protein